MSGSSESVPSSGLAVSASAPRPGTAPYGVGVQREVGLRVGHRSDVDVSALGVRDHDQTTLLGIGDDLAQRRPSGRAEPLEARHLGLDRDALLGGGLEYQTAVCCDRAAGALGWRAIDQRPR